MTEDQFARYKAVLDSPQDFIKWYSLKRHHIIMWISDFLIPLQPYSLRVIDNKRLETFLLAAEKFLAMRRQNKPLKDIVDASGDYILNHRFTWSPTIDHEEGYKRFFVGQILWSFYENILQVPSGPNERKVPSEICLGCYTGTTKSRKYTVTFKICAILSNDNYSLRDDQKMLKWRVLEFLSDAEGSGKDSLTDELENGHTINLRLALANHINDSTQREMLVKALEYPKRKYGDFHLITWECTERLGKYYLTRALQRNLSYYSPELQGDKIKAGTVIYEDFLHHAEEHLSREKTNHTSRKAVSLLLRESVVPTVAKFYMDHAKDREGRALLWSFTKDISCQLYAENWTPWTGVGKSTTLMKTIHQAGGLDTYANSKYSSLDTTIFPFDEISLQPVKPSDEEKTMKWHFVFDKMPANGVGDRSNIQYRPGLQGGYEARTITSSTDSVILEVPYITYSHFKSSQAYQLGMVYDSYRKGSIDQPQLVEWREKAFHKTLVWFEGPDYLSQVY